MNSKVAVIAAMVMASQLALAEGQPEQAQGATVEQAGSAQQAVEKAATDRQLKALERDLTPSLQMKLDEQMSFEFDPVPVAKEGIASAH